MIKKGYGALEFLLAYGWIIMVVLVAIGALAHFGILSSDKFIPRRCLLEAGVACTDFKVNEGSVTLVLRNGMGEDIEISGINVKDCSGTTSGILKKSQQSIFVIGGCSHKLNEKFSGQVNITYVGESSLSHKKTGNIVGKVEPGNQTESSIPGSSNDGDKTIIGIEEIDTVKAAVSLTSSSGQPDLSVSTTEGFSSSQEVFIIQVQGTGAGNYEFNTISSITSGILTMEKNLAKTYTADSDSRAQVIHVFNWTNVSVNNGATMTASSWDGSTGGVLVFRSNSSVTVNGKIDVKGKGFRGEPALFNYDGTQAEGTNGEGINPVFSCFGPSFAGRETNGNSGGGGGCDDPDDNEIGGGGGGGHATAGNDGERGLYGKGGNAVGSSDLSKLFFGGAGGSGGNSGEQEFAESGSGSGGNGGGIIVIHANNLAIGTSGEILTDGDDAAGAVGGCEFGAGGGGGGAGGSILITTEGTISGQSRISANGGIAGNGCTYNWNGGSGGAGANGRIKVN